VGPSGKSISPAGILILDRPTRYAVGIPAPLSWFLLPVISCSIVIQLSVWFDSATALLKLKIAITDTSYSLILEFNVCG
jgi:hypothetical protein